MNIVDSKSVITSICKGLSFCRNQSKTIRKTFKLISFISLLYILKKPYIYMRVLHYKQATLKVGEVKRWNKMKWKKKVLTPRRAPRVIRTAADDKPASKTSSMVRCIVKLGSILLTNNGHIFNNSEPFDKVGNMILLK